MVKIPTFNELKARLPNLDDLKGMLGSGTGNRSVLPEEVKNRMEEVDKKLKAFDELQKQFSDAAALLKKEVMEMCQAAISLYVPKEAPKAEAPAAQPAEVKEVPKEEEK